MFDSEIVITAAEWRVPLNKGGTGGCPIPGLPSVVTTPFTPPLIRGILVPMSIGATTSPNKEWEAVLRPRVEFLVDCFQPFLIHVGINLGRGDIGMPQHFLNIS